MRGLLYITFTLLLLSEVTISSNKVDNNNKCIASGCDSIKYDTYIFIDHGVDYKIQVLSDSLLRLEIYINYGEMNFPVVKREYLYRNITHYRIVLDSMIHEDINNIKIDKKTGRLHYLFSDIEYKIKSISDTMTFIPEIVILTNKYDCFFNATKIMNFKGLCEKDKNQLENYIDNKIIPCFDYIAIDCPELRLRLANDSTATFTYNLDIQSEDSIMVRIDSLNLGAYMYWDISLGERLPIHKSNLDKNNKQSIEPAILKGLCNTRGRILNLERVMEYVAIDSVLFKRIHTCKICR